MTTSAKHATIAGRVSLAVVAVLVSFLLMLFPASFLMMLFPAPKDSPSLNENAYATPTKFEDYQYGHVFVIEVEGRKYVVVGNYRGLAITPATP